MSEVLAGWLLSSLAIYGLAGLLFAIAFQLRGLTRIDAAAHCAGPALRLLLLPGIVALWPILLRRWWESRP